jgi:hypothetical protein
MEEILIYQIELKALFNPYVILGIVSQGYRKTGNKFSINFNGSKGYFHNITFECEGFQNEKNRLSCDEVFTKKYGIRKKLLNVFWSEENGIRVSTGKDKPRVTS